MTLESPNSQARELAYRMIESPDDIDCGRHALIEASAGTGKTYTIEYLVLRLVRDEGLSIDRILVVTFTEKAAGELKERIRARLNAEYLAHALPEFEGAPNAQDEAENRPNAGVRERLRAAVDGFDNAGIYTIHGFCHMVLSRFGFELGRPLKSEVVDDAPLVQTLLRRRMRGMWPTVYGEDLTELLEFSGFPEYDPRLDESRWERRIRRVLLSAAGEPHTLPPAPESAERLLADFRELRSQTLAIFRELSQLVGEIDSRNPGASEFAQAFARLNQKSQSRQRKLNRFIEPLLAILGELQRYSDFEADAPRDDEAAQRTSGESTGSFSATVAAKHFLEEARRAKLDPGTGFRTLSDEHWTKAGDNSAEVCPELSAVVDALERLRALDYRGLSLSLAAASIAGVAREVESYKSERACVSFQDMLQLVNDALSATEAPLTKLLREQFACAIVDEFQDTDPVQWEIFRRLYLDPGAQGVLYLVGDPKQAIYGFRGADVFAYFAARREMELLARDSRAALYRLSTNYRSVPELVQVFNEVFATPAFFGAPEASTRGAGEGELIDYAPAFESSPEYRKLSIAADETTRRALQLIQLDEAGSGTAAKRKYFRFLAREIHALVRSRKLRLSDGGVERALDFGDVCILLRTRTDAPLLEDALERMGVPHSFYKKTGLYQSREALELSLVLRAVESPGRLESGYKAALTRFFRKTPEEIDALRRADQSPGQSEEPAFRGAINVWRELAERRNWPAFFRSLLQSSDALSPPEPGSNPGTLDAQYDRAVANYEQICEELAENAVRENLDLTGIIEYLEFLRDEATPVREEWDVHRQESEDARVRLMTIHTSKGLEFPIVCLAGGFTRRMAHLYESFEYHDEHGDRIHDLLLSDEERFRAEEEAEERRLYYVALTRAAVKLYVPYYRPADARAKHSAGPLARFVRDAIDAAYPAGAADVAERALFLEADQAGDFFTDAGASAWNAVDRDSGTGDGVTGGREIDPNILFPPEPANVAVRRRDLLSYTALSRRAAASPNGVAAQAVAPEAPNITEITEDVDAAEMNAGDNAGAVTPDAFLEETARDREDAAGLPLEFAPTLDAAVENPPAQSSFAQDLDRRMRGADAGTMLHDMLENLDYAGIGGDAQRLDLTDANRRLILRHLRRNGFIPTASDAQVDGATIEDQAIEFVGHLMRRVLTTPLPEAADGFCLKDLESDQRIHELEFYFHIPRLHDQPLLSGAAANEFPGARFQDGHLWGFIDLVFRVGGRYFLADWKSNVLDEYEPHALQAAMSAHEYDLQYRIYTYALVGWLRGQIPDFDYERDFGGVFYFFLRGMEPASPGRGVYFARPAMGDDTEIFEEIRSRVSR